jgi:hypothetical protein
MLEIKLPGQFELRLDHQPVQMRSRPTKSLLEDVREPGWSV